eukprot:TRINITY_DN6652_c0_g1_i1.p1 TRINITY_DN6652_c0_g1~~TRINITY_DN6652_c0_g1_i1.p1  ORF type:complete len:830 (+),score=211.29 TRINITY_DN6652_c0_g1_i1:107-2596(+)
MAQCGAGKRADRLLLIVLGLLVGLADCDGAIELRSVGSTFTRSIFCADAIETGQAAGTCNLVAQGYPLGAGADLLMAARFRNFKAGGATASTDHNIGGVIADYELTVARSHARLDAQRSLRGTAQVDLFLCSDRNCNIIADIVHVVTEAKPNGTLAMGYTRFAHSLVALPVFHVRADDLTAVLVVEATQSRLGVARSKVAWALAAGTTEWVKDNIIMMPFGGAVRFLTLSARSVNLELGVLRAGAYLEQTGDCVVVVSFKHPWMDEMGWGTSNCDPGDPSTVKVYIFDSYFSQANLQFPPTKGKANGDNSHDVYRFLPAAMVGGGNWAGPDGKNVRSYGAALACGSEMYTNRLTMGAMRFSCVTADGNWAKSQPLSAEDLANMEPELRSNDTRWMPQLLVLGGAAISAWEITEPRLALDEEAATVGGQPSYVMDGEHQYSNYKGSEMNPVLGTSGNGGGGKAAEDDGIYTSSAAGTLVKYSVLTSEAWGNSLLPWCEIDQNRINSLDRDKDLRQAKVVAAGKFHDLQDCKMLWPLLGWGNVHGGGGGANGVATETAAARVGSPAPSGKDALLAAGLLRPSWTDLEEDPNVKKPYKTDTWGKSFMGGGVLLTSALPAGVAAVVTSAEAVLAQFNDDMLSNMEMTLTTMGAALVLSQTLVALIASYAARREVVSFFLRVLRLPPLLARLLTVGAFLIGITTPAVLTIIADLAAQMSTPNGDDTQVRWVHAQANGLGQYNVVGAVTMTFQADTDATASIFVWINLALAGIGWMWCSWSVLRGSRKGAEAFTGGGDIPSTSAPVREDVDPRPVIRRKSARLSLPKDSCLVAID